MKTITNKYTQSSTPNEVMVGKKGKKCNSVFETTEK